MTLEQWLKNRSPDPECEALLVRVLTGASLYEICLEDVYHQFLIRKWLMEGNGVPGKDYLEVRVSLEVMSGNVLDDPYWFVENCPMCGKDHFFELWALDEATNGWIYMMHEKDTRYPFVFLKSDPANVRMAYAKLKMLGVTEFFDVSFDWLSVFMEDK